MSPVLGIIASGISGHLTPPFDASAYEAIASVKLSSTTSTIIFGGIPSGYKHLQIRGTNTSTSNDNNIMLRFNGDSGSNYSDHAIYGTGSATVSGYADANLNYATAGFTGNTSNPAPCIADILDYSSNVKNKTVRAYGGSNRNGGTQYVLYVSSAWYNTAPITSIAVVHGNAGGGAVFSINTQFALYGVK